LTEIKKIGGKEKEIKYNKYDIHGSDYHHKNISKSVFKDFNATVISRYQIEIVILNHLIKNRSEKEIKILDVGCGDSAFFHLFIRNTKRKNLKLYGIDNSEIALKTAHQKNPNVVYKLADAYNIPFKDNFFDIIVSFDLIEHVTNQNKVLSEIKRVGKNNTSVIFGTPIRFCEKPHSPMHFHEFFPQEFKSLLSNYFKKIKIIQAQRLLYYFLYNYNFSLFKRRRYYFRYIFNFLTIFLKRNPFLRIKTNDDYLYYYMFAIGTISK